MTAESPRRRWRWFAMLALPVVILMATVTAALITAPRWLAPIVADRLAALGLESPRLTIRELGLEGAVITDLAVGDSRIDRVTLSWTPLGLLDGAIQGIGITGADLQARIAADGTVTLGALTPLMAHLAGDSDGSAAPLPDIRLSDVSVAADTPHGPATVDLDGRLGGTGAHPEAQGHLSLTTRAGSLTGPARLLPGPPLAVDWTASAESLVPARLTGIDLPPGLALEAVTARLAVTLTTPPTLDVTVTAERIATPRGTLDHAQTTVSGDTGKLAVSAQGHLRAPDLRVALDGHLTDLTGKRPGMKVSVVAEGGGLARLAPAETGLAGGRGTVAADLDGPLPTGADMAGLTGAADLTVTGLGLGDLSLDVDGQLALTTGADKVTLTENQAPLELALRAQDLPAPVSARLDSLGLTLSRGSLGQKVDVQGRGRVALGTGHHGRIAIDAALARPAPDAPWTLNTRDLTISDGVVILPNLRLDIPRLTTRPAGTLTAGDGDVRGRLTVTGANPPAEVQGRISGRLNWVGDELSLSLDQDTVMTLTRLSLDEQGLALADPTDFTVQPSGGPVLTINHRGRAHVQAVADSDRLALAGADGLKVAATDLHLALASGGGTRATLIADALAMTPPGGPPIRAGTTEIIAELPRQAPAELGVRLEGVRAAPWLRNALVSLTAHQTEDGAAFTVKLDQGPIHLRAEGTQNAKALSANVRLTPITFRPGGLQPGALVPGLGELVQAVSGRIGARGRITWTQGPPTGVLTLDLDALSATVDGVPIKGVSGRIRLTDLAPPRSAPGQTVTIDEVVAGLPMTNITLRLQLTPRTLHLEAVDATLAGGRLATRDVTLPLAGGDVILPLRIKGVDLGTLLDRAGVPGLSATGRLSGAIPVRILDRPGGPEILIEQGHLAADGPGTLSYTGDSAEAGEHTMVVQFAVDALSQVNYDRLTLSLAREPDGSSKAVLQVAGVNPHYKGGLPLEVDINITGDLEKILQDNIKVYTLPGRLARELEDGQ